MARITEVRRAVHRLAAAVIRSYLDRPSDEDLNGEVDAELERIADRHETLSEPTRPQRDKES